MFGERLSNLVSFEGLKLAAGLVLLSPCIPLFFMGEEYGEEASFIYFSSHSDPELIEAVRKGRKEEFKAFGWGEEPPDPQDIETFLMSKINWEKRIEGKHKVLLDFYKSLIKLRKETPALSNLSKDNLNVWGLEKERIVFMRRWKDQSCIFSIFNFNEKAEKIRVSTNEGKWNRVLDSSDDMWNGPGTLLPEIISSGDEITVRGLSLAIYKGGEI
jgi:maltooligosyltrehalose trehalohydrolase